MSTSGPKRSPVPYRRVWRWHFFAGLAVAPVLLVLALTGALYLFDDAIDTWWLKEAAQVPAVTAARSIDEQEAAVLRAYPGSRLTKYQHPGTPERAAQWSLRAADGRAWDVFVDPATARVTGAVDPATRPMAIVVALHGELMAGRVGDWLVEAAASWTLVLIATGLYLWWPRSLKWQGVVVPRLQHRGRRRWRDLHAVPGAMNSVFVVFLVMSGLPWSGFWGEKLASLGTLSTWTTPSPNFREAPTVSGLPALEAQHHHDPDDASLPWAIRHAAVPAGSGPGTTLAQVLRTAESRGVPLHAPRLRVFYPATSEGVFTVSLVPDRAQDQRTLYVDPADGRVVDDIDWTRYSPLAQAVEWGVMVHLGRQFGLVNQLAGLAVCLVIVLALAAGMVLWWRRRPAGRLGAPAPHAPATEHLPAGLKVTIVVLGVLFPMVALTFFVAWGLDMLWQRRRPSDRGHTPT